MKPVVGSANHSHALKFHFVQINDRIQDNFTPFFHNLSKEKLVNISSIPMQLDGNRLL